ncbi:hypothetical protein SD51_12145 [Alicyclobacillus tengchongensis]|nr:hypothetical protein SD51_12145 [Alicyclobacillus tengchongensis]
MGHSRVSARRRPPPLPLSVQSDRSAVSDRTTDSHSHDWGAHRSRTPYCHGAKGRAHRPIP